MLAAVYDKNSIDKFVLKEVTKPVPKTGEVLVKIHSVAVNAADYRSMQLGIIPKSRIYGADIAGEIMEAGSGTGRFKIGDKVFGDISGCGFGGFAEYVAVPEKTLAQIPENISYETAAALPMASVTALQGLRNKGNIKKGDRVLIVGAGGGVGTYAVQLAKYFGAEVTAVCGNRNIELIRQLGADHLINYNIEDFGRTGKQYNLVLGVNGNYPFTDYKRALAPGGTYVLIGGAISQIARSVLLSPVMMISGRRFRFLAARPEASDLEFVMSLVVRGEIKPVIDSTYPLKEEAQAMKYLMEGHAKGKVIIRIAP